MMRPVLISLVLASAVQAQPAPETKAETCDSCTARHNALKKRQEARVPAPPLPPPNDANPDPAPKDE